MKKFTLFASFVLFFMCLAGSLEAQSAKDLAENDTEAFLEMLEEKVTSELAIDNDLKHLKKYERWLKKIANEETRSRAKKLLLEIKQKHVNMKNEGPIKLSPRCFEMKGNPKAKKDFKEALTMAGVPILDINREMREALAENEKVLIYENVNYLDSLKDVVNKMDEWEVKVKSKRTGSKNKIESAGIPLDTFHYYTLDLEHQSDEPNRILLVMDSRDRVVAVQTIIESPKSVRLSNHNTSRSVYNFIQMRRKGTPKYKIAYTKSPQSLHRGHPSALQKGYSRGEKLIIIDSELLNQSNKPKEWVRLYLPRNIASVFLYFCK